jgi:HSP20 family protein
MFVDKWFPFFDVGKTLEEMDRMFGQMGQPLSVRSVPRGTFPAVNIYEQDNGVVLMAEVPGVAPEQLDLTVLGDTVTLKGQRLEEDLPNGERFYRRERPVGSFTRTLTLPEPIDPNSVKAQYKNGVLTVRMEKAEQAKAKKITIKS